MKKRTVMFFTVYSLVWLCSVFAYDPRTHQDLSGAAIDSSVLRTDPTVLFDLGLKSLEVSDQLFPNSESDKKRITLLIQDGAVFEDNGRRPLNHLYNPLTNDPLIHPVCSLPLLSCNPSPDWALEEQTTYSEQDNSFRDTRQFFLNALTLQSKNAREEAWGRTFQGLGQIIHHLQDMAQPQHVRNDAHQEASYLPAFLENPSLYEHYTAKDDPQDNVRARVVSFFGGYAPVYSSDDPATFNSPRKLWHTSNRKGIADYTNRGFVSAGTNFDQIAGPMIFHQPDITSGTITIEDKTALCQEISERSGAPLPRDGAGQALPCLMAFIGTEVEDSYRPDQSGHNAKTSTFSIFDAELTKYFQLRLATLNKFNFEAAYPFLMKRAVGYSAGLINYFFRGKIDLAPDPDRSGQLLVKNLSTERLSGTLALYYDDVNDNRHPVVLRPPGTSYGNDFGTEWTIPGSGLAPQETVAFPAFTAPEDPTPRTPGKYLLVFKGEMGEEKPVNGSVGAIAAKEVSLQRASAFLTPYGRLIFSGTSWIFHPDSTLQYGNVDWQGQGRTLSWIGPFGRHVGLRKSHELSTTIYSRGQVLTQAPGHVVGAAIFTLHDEQQNPVDYLVALTAPEQFIPDDPDNPDPEQGAWQQTAVECYITPLANPTSWQLVAQLELTNADEEQTGVPLTTQYPQPWFFHPQGMEAQAVLDYIPQGTSEALQPKAIRRYVLQIYGPTSATFTLSDSNEGFSSQNQRSTTILHAAVDYLPDGTPVSLDYRDERYTTIDEYVITAANWRRTTICEKQKNLDGLEVFRLFFPGHTYLLSFTYLDLRFGVASWRTSLQDSSTGETIQKESVWIDPKGNTHEFLSESGSGEQIQTALAWMGNDPFFDVASWVTPAPIEPLVSAVAQEGQCILVEPQAQGNANYPEGSLGLGYPLTADIGLD